MTLFNDLGDFDLGNFDIGDFNLRDFDLTPFLAPKNPMFRNMFQA